jgi:hypothetical protein
MFIDNKYTKYYYQIVNRAKTRELLEYTEKHHVIPKSIGGSNALDNLVKLTAREHFVCHLLLVRITVGKNKAKMTHALSMMLANNKNQQRNYRITSRVFEKLRKDLSTILKEKWTDDLRKKRSEDTKGSKNPFYGKNHTQETKEKLRSKVVSPATRKLISDNQKKRFNELPGTFTGKTHTIETKEKIRLSRIGKKDSEELRMKKSISAKNRPPVSNETRKKLSAASKGRPGKAGELNGFFGKTHSQEQRQKKREEKLSATRQTCLYCNKIIDPMNYARWHGDNCKNKK